MECRVDLVKIIMFADLTAIRGERRYIMTKFWIGIKSASSIDVELNSVSKVIEWIENNEMDYFLPNYLTIATSSGYSLCTIDLHTIPYSHKDTLFQIIMKGIEKRLEDLTGVEIQL